MFANMGNQFYGVRIGRETELIRTPSEPALIHGMYRPEFRSLKDPKSYTPKPGVNIGPIDPETGEPTEPLAPSRDVFLAHKKMIQAERERQQLEKYKRYLEQQKAPAAMIAVPADREKSVAKSVDTQQKKLEEMGFDVATTGDIYAAAAGAPSVTPKEALPAETVEFIKTQLPEEIIPGVKKKKKKDASALDVKFAKSPYEKALREFGYDVDLSPEEDVLEMKVSDPAVADSLMTRIKKGGWDVPLITKDPMTIYGKKGKGDIESLAKELI